MPGGRPSWTWTVLTLLVFLTFGLSFFVFTLAATWKFHEPILSCLGFPHIVAGTSVLLLFAMYPSYEQLGSIPKVRFSALLFVSF